MAEHNIVVLAGDHCGPQVLKTSEENKPSVSKFNLWEHLMGGTRPSPPSSPAPSAVQNGAPAPSAPSRVSSNSARRWGAYGHLRPCLFASDSLVDSWPLKAKVYSGTDFVISANNSSGSAWNAAPYSRAEVERIIPLAGFLACGHGDKKVWSLDKANVLAMSRLWRKVMTETVWEVEHQLIDSAVMIMVKNPTGLNGVVTSNLFGGIISYETGFIPGSIGLLPSASLNGIPVGNGKCNGIYEPIHSYNVNSINGT
ncbi:hypothetical protein Neosp_000307 [[Neocosmospora] mangrovei]